MEISCLHGRQTATRLDDVRADHRYRYEWAGQRLRGKKVLDAGCGIGYGSWILGEHDCDVMAVDIDPGAIETALKAYPHLNVSFSNQDITSCMGEFDAVVCFEVLEHIDCADFLAWRFRQIADRLLCSVPNELEYPFEQTKPLGHLRHYTPGQFHDLLRDWTVEEHGQRGKYDPVEPGFRGRTLVADCR